MRILKNVSKRLLALALAVLLVVGYFPAQASAAQEATLDGFTVSWTSEVTGAMIPEGSSDYEYDEEGNLVKPEYTYTLTLPDGATYEWTSITSNANPMTCMAESATAKVTLGDKVLTVTCTAPTTKRMNEESSGSATWAAAVTWSDFNAGDTITAPSINCTSGEYAGTVAWTLTAANGTVAVGETATTTKGALKATASIAGQSIELDATVSKVAATGVTFDKAPGWYTTAPSVTATATNAVPSADDLVAVDAGTWTAASGAYTLTFTPVAGQEYTIGDATGTWNVDDVTPTITVTDAYVSGENTYIDATVTTGASGISTLTVGGQAARIVGTQLVVDNQKLSGEVEINATSVAGLPATPVKVTVKPDVTVTITPPEANYESNGVKYVNGTNKTFKIAAANVVEGITKWVIGGADVTGTEAEQTYTLTGTLTNLTATVTEVFHSRTATGEWTGNYVLDESAPSISNPYAYIDGEDTVVKVSVSDTQSGVASITFNGKAADEVKDGKYILKGQKPAQVAIIATDNVGNSSQPAAVDVAPALTVAIDETNAKNQVKTTYDNASYLNVDTEVKTITVTISGVTVNGGNAMAGKLPEIDNLVWGEYDATNNNIVGTLTLPGYTEGEVTTVLNGLTVAVTDSEGRNASAAIDTVYKYDAKAPVVTITVPTVSAENPGVAGDPTTYFYKNQTVTIKIEDDLPVTYSLDYVKNKADVKEEKLSAKEYTLTVTNNESLGTIFASVFDACDNYGYARALDGDEIMVDTHEPEVSATVSASVNKFYKYGDNWFAEVEPVENEGGVAGFLGLKSDKTVEVSVTVQIKDNNLTTTVYTSELGGWTASEADADGNITYTNTFTESVKSNEVKTLTIDVPFIQEESGRTYMKDIVLATAGGSSDGNLNTTYTMTPDEDGDYAADLNIDRRSPETEADDNGAPVVTLTPKSGTCITKANGVKIYNGAFSYTLNVEDTGSGIKSVEWSLKGDDRITISAAPGEYTEFTASASADLTITPEANVEGATTLTITVKDNMGNSYVYTENFEVDNYAPRMSVNVSGTSVRSNEYFNKARTATITVEDANLPAAGSADFAKYIKVTSNGTAGTWTKSGNTYTCTYSFNNDGKYEFSMTGKDMLNNEGKVTYTGEHPNKFVVDKTAPIITVAYNPNVPSGYDGTIRHYDEDVTASITIREVNFNAADVVDKFVNSGHNLVPGSWRTNGDVNSASVTFGEGNNYSFSIDYTDMAGNPADTYRSFVFCVDLHAPTIKITKGDLTTKELNIVQDDLSLGITINDTEKNLSNYSVTVTHLDSSFKKTTVTGKDYYTVTTVEDRTTVTVDFAKIAAEKANDGLYTVEITAQDYAGHKVTLGNGLEFSLNRFGSAFFSEDEYTLEFLTTGSDGNAYHKSVDNKLVIMELNPNKVYTDSTMKTEGSVLTVVVNGTTTKLVEGEDYKMTVTEEGTGTNKWYVYSYAIDPEVFEDNGTTIDGRYSILVYGEDAAGNKNTNEANDSGKLQKDSAGEYNGKIEFTLDATAPIITTTGIENGKTYNAAAQKLEIFLSDNTPTGIAVYLNGELVKLSETMDGLVDTSAYLVWNEESGCYVLNVPEQDGIFDSQNVKAVATDAAGNMSEEAIEDFIVSTNLLVRMLNSFWFYLILVLLLLVAAALGIYIWKKKKN